MIKLFCAILLTGITFISSSWVHTGLNSKNSRKFLVTGSIMQTTSYCGGAQPTQKILDSFNTPKGIPFGKLFVKSGAKNIEGAPVIERINADANGNFSVYLPEGKYCFVEEWKIKPFKLPLNNVNHKVDSTCFRNLYDSPDFSLNITNKNIHHLEIILHRTCPDKQPCVSFHGALHP